MIKVRIAEVVEGTAQGDAYEAAMDELCDWLESFARRYPDISAQEIASSALLATACTQSVISSFRQVAIQPNVGVALVTELFGRLEAAARAWAAEKARDN